MNTRPESLNHVQPVREDAAHLDVREPKSNEALVHGYRWPYGSLKTTTTKYAASPMPLYGLAMAAILGTQQLFNQIMSGHPLDPAFVGFLVFMCVIYGLIINSIAKRQQKFLSKEKYKAAVKIDNNGMHFSKREFNWEQIKGIHFSAPTPGDYTVIGVTMFVFRDGGEDARIILTPSLVDHRGSIVPLSRSYQKSELVRALANQQPQLSSQNVDRNQNELSPEPQQIALPAPSYSNLRKRRLKGFKDVRPLEICSGEEWRIFVSALKQYCPLQLDIKDNFFKKAKSEKAPELAYTKLWLESLSAPPRRDRLQPLAPGTKLQGGAYCVEKQIGVGGQARAYLSTISDAHQLPQGIEASVAASHISQVVLKECILPVYVDVKVQRRALESFQREAQMLGSLRHPSIVTMYDAFVEDHRAYLVLEYIEGQSLREIIRSQGSLSEAKCAQLAVEMCDVLQVLHSHEPPVVHQDFTPDNLLISRNGTIKLIDFMVAKHQSGEICTNTVVGKHHYIPPEQFRGKATTRSDIYSLGATLSFMLTGEEPEPMSVSHPRQLAPSVCPELDSIIARATALAETDRYQSAQAVKDDLLKLSAPNAHEQKDCSDPQITG